jgi:DNA-binding transcriptional regulator YiaG
VRNWSGETRPEQVRKAEVLARVADMRKVEPGISMRKLAQYVEVSESTLRSWLKNEKTD